ncbi:MAG: GAF domain-containing protein [Anaerolineae bacterium]|nr:GAF domain-containing protein [Anaerolineae bacterium]
MSETILPDRAEPLPAETAENSVTEDGEILSPRLQMDYWRERIINTVLNWTAVLALIALAVEAALLIPDRLWGLVAILGVVYVIILVIAVFRRIPTQIRITIFMILFYLIGLLNLTQSGLGGEGRFFMIAFPLLVLILLGWKAGVIALAFSAVTLVAVGVAMVSGIIPLTVVVESTDLVSWLTAVAVYALLVALTFGPTIYIVNNLYVNLSKALDKSHSRWRRVRDLSQNLEQQVAQRTQELARRSAKLEASAQVTREATAIRDVDKLLDKTVHLISNRFGFYHAGIFLVDEVGKYAVLRAANSAGGQQMLARGHRLKIGEVGIVGHVASTGQPRIALDVGEDAIFFDNPDLPNTRSEMALPLLVRDAIIGVLDVQSIHPEAFSGEDIAILQTMADQVSLAIENARLLAASQDALRELQLTYGEYSRAAWENLEQFPAFEYDRVEVRPTGLADYPVVEQALSTGQSIARSKPDDGTATLVTPLRLREQIIGTIALEERGEARQWSGDEIELVQEVSDQVARALESARLYQIEQQRRRVADTLRETARVVSSTLDQQEVIDLLLDQLGRLIPFDTASIQLIQDEQRELIGGRGFDLEAAQAQQDLLRPISEDLLFAELVANRTPVVIPDTLVDPRWEHREETASVRSWLAAPLVIGEEVIGMLTVDHHRPHTYNEEMGGLASAIAAQAAIAIQNARFYTEAQQSAREQEGLARVAAFAASTLNLDALLTRLLEEARQLIGAETTVLMLLDEERQALVGSYLSLQGELSTVPEDWNIPLDTPGFEHSIFARGGTYYSNKGIKDPHLIPAYVPYMEYLQVKNFGGVALLARDQSIGELYATNRPGGFGPEVMRLLQAVAGYIANAIQNARLFEETQQRVSELGLLFDASRALSGAVLQTEDIILATARQLSRVVGSNVEYSFSLLDEQAGTLQTVTDFILDEEGNPQTREFGETINLADYPATARVIESQQPLIVQASDPKADPAELSYMHRYQRATMLVIPLTVKGQAIGILELETTEERHYSQEQVNLVMTLANQAAVALENAQLFQQTARRAEKERQISEITGRIRTANTLEAIVRTAAQEIGRALGSSRVLVQVGLEGAAPRRETDQLTQGSESGGKDV